MNLNTSPNSAQITPIIGCEIHVELLTKSKAFCSCENRYGGMPNTRTCPVCLGLPGAMPAPSQEYIEFGIRAGLALNCDIANFTKFDRKHYMYPDLVKGYQISQNELPLCTDGFVDINLARADEAPRLKRIRIERIHLEEDVGKSLHVEGNHSYIDYNRSGVPLIEIVTRPDFSSPEEASIFMQTVREILRYIGITDGNLEEGSMRCDANINLHIELDGSKYRTPIAEIKNMNSFKTIRDACAYEIKRQTAEFLDPNTRTLFQAGFKNTLGWDEAKGETVLQRTKEAFIDYRFVIEPDIKPFYIDENFIEAAQAQVGELPYEKRERFKTEYGLTDFDANTLTSEKSLAEWFEQAALASKDPKKIANWVLAEVLAIVNEQNTKIESLSIQPEDLASLVNSLTEGSISSKQAKEVFAEMLSTGEDPSVIIKKRGFVQLSDTSAIEAIVDQVLAQNPTAVADYKNGKTNVLGWLTGQVMKQSRGQANPATATAIVTKKLNE